MTTKRKKKTKESKRTRRKWSKHVNETSDALDLSKGVFKKSSGKEIARSLKRSAERSHRKKGTPYQSAMSMLNFYINRGGKNLSPSRKKVLNSAKNQLKKLFDK